MQIDNIKIHGHEVLEMMTASGKTYSNESLLADVETKFGKTARYHTCSAEDMTAAELIEFLWGHGKFAGTPEAFVFDTGKRCDH